MKLFDMYQFMNFIVNKDYEGNAFTPAQFGQMVKVANIEMLKVKMGLPEEYAPGQAISRQGLDLTQRLTDETKFLKEVVRTATLSNNPLSYPNDYFTISSLRIEAQKMVSGSQKTITRIVEILTEEEYSSRAGTWLKQPTEWSPVGVVRKNGIYLYPETTFSGVELAYIRYPAAPVFGYTTQTGYIEENSGATTEFEWPEILHMDLVRIMLSYLGIHLREEQLYAYAEAKKAQGV